MAFLRFLSSKLSVTFLVVFLSGVASQAQLDRDLYLKDLSQMAAIFENHYAPLAWKKAHVGLDLMVEKLKAEQAINSSTTAREARQALINYLLATQDYHVGFRFISTERATLGFQVKTVNQQTFITWIDRTLLPQASFPFQIGDQVIEFENKPVFEVIDSLKNQFTRSVVQTDIALADYALTRRLGSRNQVVPQDRVTLKIQRKDAAQAQDIQLSWDYVPEQIPPFSLLKTPQNQFTNLNAHDFIAQPLMFSTQASAFSEPSANPFVIGARDSFLPDLGVRIWESAADNLFEAYIYQNSAGQLIGYVRIPNYTPQDPQAAVAAFGQIIKKFQQQTSALVIDQLNNPGGSVFYLYALASYFVDRDSFTTPLHRMAITAFEANNCITAVEGMKSINNDADAQRLLGSNIAGYPMSHQFVLSYRNYCRFLLREWSQKRTLTSPFYLAGVDRIAAHPSGTYTKPVYVLVNELDFSGGDFFPAILQDNKRAQIIGTRTAGAGGYVYRQNPTSFSGIELFSYTASIAERANLQPIENLGVTPDVNLEVTASDLQNNYASYLQRLLQIVK